MDRKPFNLPNFFITFFFKHTSSQFFEFSSFRGLVNIKFSGIPSESVSFIITDTIDTFY